MRTLSEFLAEHILNRDDYTDEEYADILQHYIEDLHNGILKYQEHLKADLPFTVQWKMIELQCTVALSRMEKGNT